jgi:tetratricopeptide (TPR) repeat protein
VLCDSLSAVPIGGGERSLNGVCPEPRAVTIRGGRPRSLARPAGVNLLPFIIEPRASRTLSPPKSIRWNATKPPYSVSIADADQTSLADMNDVLTNSLDLDTNLTWQKEMTYTVTVVDANGAYSENGWFYLLADDQAAVMNEQTALLTSNLHREGAPQEGVLQAQAALYQANGLYADALAILEPLAQTTDQPMTLFILAECYRLTGKYQMAIEHYGRAQATVRNDREWLMLAFIAQGSGMSARMLRENDKARLELQKARGIFIQLLQNNYAKEIDGEISKISNP